MISANDIQSLADRYLQDGAIGGLEYYEQVMAHFPINHASQIEGVVDRVRGLFLSSQQGKVASEIHRSAPRLMEEVFPGCEQGQIAAFCAGLYLKAGLPCLDPLLSLAIEIERRLPPQILQCLFRKRENWSLSPGAFRLEWGVRSASGDILALEKIAGETVTHFKSFSEVAGHLDISDHDVSLWAGGLSIVLHRSKVQSLPLTALVADGNSYRQEMEVLKEQSVGGIALPWGVSTRAKLHSIRFDRTGYCYAFFCSSGGGKSGLLRNLIPGAFLAGYTPSEIQFFIVDGGSKTDMAPLAQTPYSFYKNKSFRGNVEGATELQRAFNDLNGEISRRQKLINDFPGVTNWVEFNESGGSERIPALVLLFDEFKETRRILTENKDVCKSVLAEIDATLNRIGSEGRSAGVFFVIASQVANKEDIGACRDLGRHIFGTLPQNAAKSFDRVAGRLKPYSFYDQKDATIFYSFDSSSLYQKSWESFVQAMNNGSDGTQLYSQMVTRTWDALPSAPPSDFDKFQQISTPCTQKENDPWGE